RPFFFSSRRRHTRCLSDWSSDVCSSDLNATKFGVRALTEGMNLDVAGTPIRVSAVDPGLVETEFSEVRFHGDKERAAAVYQGLKPLSADDVADAIAYIVNLPEHVNILALVIMPTVQRNVYIVDREIGRASCRERVVV